MTKRSLNKILEKANGNSSMKEFVILKTTKHMIKSMIMKTVQCVNERVRNTKNYKTDDMLKVMKTMIAGQITINL